MISLLPTLGETHKNIQQMIWQGLIEYARHAWDAARKEANNGTTHKDVLGDYDKIWGANELLYH